MLWLAYQKMGPGELEAWLEERQLPLCGGTVPTLSTEELRAAYPYLLRRGNDAVLSVSVDGTARAGGVAGGAAAASVWGNGTHAVD
jgi:hypothetical protein